MSYKTVAVILLTSLLGSSGCQAYSYTITNNSDQNIDVQIEFSDDKQLEYQFKPSETHTLTREHTTHCIHALRVSPGAGATWFTPGYVSLKHTCGDQNIELKRDPQSLDFYASES
jgi:hypothetical protein